MDTPLGHFDARRLAPSPVPARKRASVRAVALQFLGGALFGGAAAAGFGVLHRAGWVELPPPGLMAVGLVALLPAVWLHVLLHEAGHAAAGLATGKRAVGFGLGPWRMERGQSGWHARRGGGVQGIGGFALLLPDGGRGAGRGADAAFLLSGPLANLLVAGGVVAAWPLLPDVGPLRAVLAAFGAAGVLIGLVNLVPFRSRGWSSDGLALWQLLRDAPSARVARAHRMVAALAFQGVRPRDWPAEAVHAADDVDGLTPLEHLGMAMLRLQAALDRGDALQARAAALTLAGLQADAPDGVRQAVALGLAAHAALVEHDVALLDAWLERGDGGLLDSAATRAWLAAEAAWLRNDAGRARMHLAKARDALPRVHDVASVQVLGERLDALEDRLDAAVPTGAGAIQDGSA